jgi:hypothetical protein
MSAILNDPERNMLRIVIGATKGQPIVLADGRQILKGAAIDQPALRALLLQHGSAERTSHDQQIAAVARAYEQAVQR